jgi:hypothetical protein
MIAAEVRRRLRARLQALAESEEARPCESAETRDAADSSIDAAQQCTQQHAGPEQPVPIPPAILFDVLHGCGWSRPVSSGRLARPGDGPLVVRRLRE